MDPLVLAVWRCPDCGMVESLVLSGADVLVVCIDAAGWGCERDGWHPGLPEADAFACEDVHALMAALAAEAERGRLAKLDWEAERRRLAVAKAAATRAAKQAEARWPDEPDEQVLP